MIVTVYSTKSVVFEEHTLCIGVFRCMEYGVSLWRFVCYGYPGPATCYLPQLYLVCGKGLASGLEELLADTITTWYDSMVGRMMNRHHVA